MFRSLADFEQAWLFESESTLKLFRAVPDESRSQSVVTGGRSLAFLAWHITGTLGEMLRHAQIPNNLPDELTPLPATMAEIAESYRQAADALLPMVKAAWNDADLDTEIPMYGENWKKGFILTALISHQAHHRGQMTVLMRQAGLRVPGVAGPAKEEWAAYGMPEQP